MSRSKDDMDIPTPTKFIEQYPTPTLPSYNIYDHNPVNAKTNNNASSTQLPYIVPEPEYNDYQQQQQPDHRHDYPHHSFAPSHQQPPPPPPQQQHEPPQPIYYNDNSMGPYSYYNNDPYMSPPNHNNNNQKIDPRRSKFQMIPIAHEMHDNHDDQEYFPQQHHHIHHHHHQMGPPVMMDNADDHNIHKHARPDDHEYYAPMSGHGNVDQFEPPNNNKKTKRKKRNRVRVRAKNRKYHSKRNKDKDNDKSADNDNNESDNKNNKNKRKQAHNVRWQKRVQNDDDDGNGSGGINNNNKKETLSTSNSGRVYPNMRWSPKKPKNNDTQTACLNEEKTDKKNGIGDDNCGVDDDDDDSDDNEIVTKYKSSVTTGSRFFTQTTDLDNIPFKQCTLILPTIGVGNVGQIAVDILLTSLHCAKECKIGKIGYITDRNVVSAVGNDAFFKGKKSKKSKENEESGVGLLNTAIEVYWYSELNLCIIQQRNAIRFGGRGEYVSSLMQWINKYDFQDILVLTSEFRTKRSDLETKNGTLFSYYYTPLFGIKSDIPISLKWSASKLNKSPTQIRKNDDDEKKGNEDEFDIIGGGICNKLYLECVSHAKSMIVICQYTEDGDNSQESKCYLQNVVDLVDALKKENVKLSDLKLKYPHSLSYANGGKLPNGIY